MSPSPAPQVQLLQGEQYTLLENTDPHTWVVQGPGGETKRAPAACFCIPAPDPEAVARASKLASEMQALKQKLATAQSRLKASVAEPLRPGQQGTTGWPGSGVGGCWNRGSGLLLSPLLGCCGGPGWPWSGMSALGIPSPGLASPRGCPSLS